MATLSNTKIKDTYQSLVKFNDNGNITTSPKRLTDGFGNVSPFYVSTTQVGIGTSPNSSYNLHVYGNVKVGANLDVSGNLTVNGTLTYLNVTDLAVEDPLIKLAKDNDANTLDIGLFGKYAISTNVKYKGFFNDASDDKFKLFTGLTTEPTTTVDTSDSGYAVGTLVANVEGTLTGVIASSTTATTQNAGDNSTKVATTAYVDTAAGNYLPLSGGTMTGDIAMGTNNISGGGTATFTTFTGDLTGNVTGGTISGTTGTFSDRITAQNGITVTGGATGADIYINNTSPTLGFTDSNSFTDPNDIYIVRAATNNLQFKWYDNSAGTTTETFNIDSSGNATFTGNVTSKDTFILEKSDGKRWQQLFDGNNWNIRYYNGTNWSADALAIDTSNNATFAGDITTTGKVTIGTGIINPSIGGDIAITQGAIGLRINDAASAITPTTATLNNDNAVDLGVSNIRFRNLYMGGTGTFGGQVTIPETPTADAHAASKKYVDDNAGGNQTLAEVLATGNTSGANDLIMADDQTIGIGTGSDLFLTHDQTNSIIGNTTGNLYIRNDADDKDIVFQCDDGSGGRAEYFRVDGSSAINIFSKHVRLFDNIQLQIGNGQDIKIYHNSTSGNSNIENHTGSLYITNYADDEDIVFRSDNGSGDVIEYFRLDGSTNTIPFGRSPHLPDALKLYFGSSTADDGSIRWDSTASQLFIDGESKFLDDLYVVGNQTIGNTLIEADRVLKIQTAAEYNTDLQLRESTDNYGFTMRYDGTANQFKLIRHDNSATGVNVITIGRGGNTVTFAGALSLGGVLNMNNQNINNVNALTFNDAGGGEGISWNGGNIWKIFESPNDLSNAAGNLQFVKDTARTMTLDTSGNLELPVGNLKITATNSYLIIDGATKSGWEIFSPSNAFVHMDVRDHDTDSAMPHKYARNSADNGYRAYYENWYDGNSYHRIGAVNNGFEILGKLKVVSDTGIEIRNEVSGSGSKINFSDQLPTSSQTGTFAFYHSDSVSIGSGASFHFESTETQVSIVAGDADTTGKFYSYPQADAGEVDFGWAIDTDTGMYRPAANQVGLVAGASRKLLVNTDGVQVQNGTLYVTSGGSAASPAIQVGDTDSGFYDSGANEISVALGGVQKMQFNPSGLTVYGDSSVIYTGNSGDFITNDANNYPRITLTDASVQLGLFRRGGAAGGMYIGADSGGFDLRDASFAIQMSVSQTGNMDLRGTILCDNSVVVAGLDAAGNVGAAADSLRVTGYGIMGSRTGNIYITNSNTATNAAIVFGVRGVHNANNKLVINENDSTFFTNITANNHIIKASGTADNIVRSEYDSTKWAQFEANSSGGVVKGSGGGGFMIRSYGETSFNGGNIELNGATGQNVLVKGGTMNFGIPGNGTNVNGRFCTIEGNTDSSGEGSGRIFFAEHNSSTTNKEKYGMSLGYRGGATTLPSGFSGLTQIGNGQWGMWGHDNSQAGDLIMAGTRSASQLKLLTDTVEMKAQQRRVKLSVWSGSTYGFGMESNYTFGGLNNNYAITCQMSNTHDRGWWFGDSSHSKSQGAFACTTQGKFTIAHSLRMGYGEGDTTRPGETYRLDVSGKIRATDDILAYSDARVKTNVKTIDNALEKVTKLRGVSYNRIDSEDTSNKIGVIAQEVKEVLPEIVTKDNEGMYSVAYSKMAGVFIEAIKDLKAEINELKKEIKELKSK